jgi:hypothetical protein
MQRGIRGPRRGLLACVAMAAAVTLAVPAAYASHPIQTGFYLGVHGASTDLSYQRAYDAGTSVVRLTVVWSDVVGGKPPADPSSPDDPAYDWSWIDSQVALAVSHHLTPLLTLYKAPTWAQSGKGDRTTGGVGVDAKAFAQFATAAARHFDGSQGHPRVRYWEAWNEPNVQAYLAPQFKLGSPASPAAYRTMVNAFAAAVHGVSGSNLVVAGGLSPFTVVRGSTVTIGPLRFMRSMLCMSGGASPRSTCDTKVNFDVWSTHPYTSGNATHHAVNPNDVSLGDLPTVRALIDAAYAAGHIGAKKAPRLWVTEFSWDTNPPDPGGVPMTLHARWTAEALYQMWSSGVDLVIWLMLYDNPYPDTSAQAGLYFLPPADLRMARPKLSLTSYTFPFVAYSTKGRVLVWARTPWGRPGTVFIERRNGSSWRRVAVLHADRYGIATRTLSGTFRATDRLRARTSKQSSLAFSLTQPPDRIVSPFGK